VPDSWRRIPPVHFLLALLACAGLDRVLPVARPITGGWRMLGAVPALLGGVLTIWADGLFKQADTTVKPDGEPSALVTAGPFGISRNPMYLGMVLVLLGFAWGLGSVTPFLVAPVFAVLVQRTFILSEEESLRRKFGPVYEEYARRIRRWV
jgi:protein-S-isoprenylcysteine O-methyltransferase Ste14